MKIAGGSSPLARGLPERRTRQEQPLRIIPARAGFTSVPQTGSDARQDHPRSRGVYASARLPVASAAGSSPLARGLHARRCRHRHRPGIIPARAGFTAPLGVRARSSADHPRSRGVYNGRESARISSNGSSPLARGLRRRWGSGPAAPRIIPARAGFTRCGGGGRARPPDHPRSRGVYSSDREAGTRPRGSSPLARGLRRTCGC